MGSEMRGVFSDTMDYTLSMVKQVTSSGHVPSVGAEGNPTRSVEKKPHFLHYLPASCGPQPCCAQGGPCSSAASCSPTSCIWLTCGHRESPRRPVMGTVHTGSNLNRSPNSALKKAAILWPLSAIVVLEDERGARVY